MFRTLSRKLKIMSFIDDAFKKQSRFYASAVGGGRRLEGKVVLITGSASGLGKASAHEFIQHGAQVIIADRDTLLGPQVAKELGPSAHFVECDVTDEAQVAEAINVAIDRHGKLDIMYNNAGITGPTFPHGIAELNLADFDRVMNINLRGTVAGIKHAARVMVPTGSGSILCTSSISGILGGLGPYPYAMSKFSIQGIVKFAASELGKSGIRINCISPAPIPTPMSLEQIGKFYPGLTQEQITKIVDGLGELQGARCEPLDVARAAVFLASEDAKYITGQNLVVDGGFTSFKNLKFPSPEELARP